jgi:hypothetical protein
MGRSRGFRTPARRGSERLIVAAGPRPVATTWHHADFLIQGQTDIARRRSSARLVPVSATTRVPVRSGSSRQGKAARHRVRVRSQSPHGQNAQVCGWVHTIRSCPGPSHPARDHRLLLAAARRSRRASIISDNKAVSICGLRPAPRPRRSCGFARRHSRLRGPRRVSSGGALHEPASWLGLSRFSIPVRGLRLPSLTLRVAQPRRVPVRPVCVRRRR